MSWGVNEQWLRSMLYPLFHWMIHWLRTVKYWKHQGTMCPSTSSCWQTWSAGKIPPLCSRIVPFKPPFIGIIPMFFQWFSHDVAIQTSIYREFSYMYHYVSICPIYSHDFPMIFLYSHDFPMFFPWFSHDFPMIFLWCSYENHHFSRDFVWAGCQAQQLRERLHLDPRAMDRRVSQPEVPIYICRFIFIDDYTYIYIYIYCIYI